ncbi:HAMP domain-containing protein [Azoarcus sp. TTM-91]|uniref:ATP-binding protein n=1 Tax=Azoarcus sp. TTM-91 TaxID=2691581 RepID=UPI00145DC044|nr:HAMP domain-containing protein [Azoarcus sp. TTM-91]
MGRLFWKFFFAYWLALVSAAVAVGIGVSLHQRGESARAPLVDPRARFAVEAAAGLLRSAGPAVLADVLREWRLEGPEGLLAVDDAGRELLARPVPGPVLARARRAVATSATHEAVREVSLAGGGRYLLFMAAAPEPPPPPPPPLHAPSRALPIAAGLIASLAFSACLAWYLAKPIRNLRWAFEATAAGRLETRVQPLMGSRRDEIADLGRDFDRMAARLQSLMAAQRRLLHDVSHELRSPLARLQVAIGLARQRPDSVGASLERIEREAGRVDELVGELLTLSRLDAGMGEQLPPETVDLVEMVAEIAEDAGFEARNSGRQLTLSATGEALCRAQAALLYRAFENVIRNGVKYTAEGSTVEVEAGPGADGCFRLQVADRGPGVAAADLEAIFEPFYRGGSNGVVGFGLGLAIARGAVQLHGGSISAAAREGGGLRVEILLPLQA